MSWIETAFTLPTITADIESDVDSMLSNIPNELSSAATRLGALPVHDYVVTPISIDCAGIGSTWAQLVDVMDSESFVVSIHPWVDGEGQGDDVYQYISPINAVESLAVKLEDINDSHLPNDEKEAVVVMVYASTMHEFENQLNAFNVVFPIPEFQMVQRRAKQLVSLETEKIKLPNPSKNNRWSERNVLQHDTPSEFLSLLSDRVAISVGYDEGSNSPVAELEALIVKKQQHLSDTKSNYDNAVSSLVGGAGKSIFISSRSMSAIASELRSSSPPGHEYSLCAAMLVVADAGELTFLREVLGL
ncbi:MAG: hypothetical protein JKY93_01725 [Gammaproteobacteria bacterium]|nr:hypothetical protein [Gammaproteobacteria bacterium]